jgi:hypothetical protein
VISRGVFLAVSLNVQVVVPSRPPTRSPKRTFMGRDVATSRFGTNSVDPRQHGQKGRKGSVAERRPQRSEQSLPCQLRATSAAGKEWKRHVRLLLVQTPTIRSLTR